MTRNMSRKNDQTVYCQIIPLTHIKIDSLSLTFYVLVCEEVGGCGREGKAC
jgi:hypothetical protein